MVPDALAMAVEPLLDDRGQVVAPLLLVDLDAAHPPALSVGDRAVIGVATKTLGQSARDLTNLLDLTLSACRARGGGGRPAVRGRGRPVGRGRAAARRGRGQPAGGTDPYRGAAGGPARRHGGT